ncbi:hypothetical protein PORCAN_805 [Porphyromonas crevioricanis JCM 13913]|nr:hypothetical protein PORCAN_805 [Porphyromonas crevioricanis JCM 13913]
MVIAFCEISQRRLSAPLPSSVFIDKKLRRQEKKPERRSQTH